MPADRTNRLPATVGVKHRGQPLNVASRTHRITTLSGWLASLPRVTQLPD